MYFCWDINFEIDLAGIFSQDKKTIMTVNYATIGKRVEKDE